MHDANEENFCHRTASRRRRLKRARICRRSRREQDGEFSEHCAVMTTPE